MEQRSKRKNMSPTWQTEPGLELMPLPNLKQEAMPTAAPQKLFSRKTENIILLLETRCGFPIQDSATHLLSLHELKTTNTSLPLLWKMIPITESVWEKKKKNWGFTPPLPGRYFSTTPKCRLKIFWENAAADSKLR